MPVRFRILAPLTLISFANYFLRNNLSVALQAITEAFHSRTPKRAGSWAASTSRMRCSRFPGGVFGEKVGHATR